MNIFKTLTTVVLLLALSGAAQAAELFTPALPPVEAGNWMQCVVVNVQTAPLVVKVQAFDSLGNKVADSGDLTLAAGAGDGLSIPAGGAPFYCKFTVRGPSKAVRASISVLQPGVGLISALAAQ